MEKVLTEARLAEIDGDTYIRCCDLLLILQKIRSSTLDPTIRVWFGCLADSLENSAREFEKNAKKEG